LDGSAIPGLRLSAMPIDSYQSAMLLAAVVAGALGWRAAARIEGIGRGRVLVAILLLGVAAFAGGRLHYVLTHPADFRARPFDVLALWGGGLHAPGAVAVLVLATPVVLGRLHVPLGKFADALAPSVGIGIAIARVGCLLAGCCFGAVCHWPWCPPFPRRSGVGDFQAALGLLPPQASHTLPVHVLPLYFAAAGLLVTLVAVGLRGRGGHDGEPALVALLVYSASAALLEPLRADHLGRVYWGPLPQLEWVAILMTIGSAAALAAVARAPRAPRARRPETVCQGRAFT
jgi:phosphatidylglycerol:prolipoprotein diacylglycerol transferase